METRLGRFEQRFLMTDIRHYTISLVIIFAIQAIYLRDIGIIFVWVPFFLIGLFVLHIGAHIIFFRKEDNRRKRLWRDKYVPPESFDRAAITGKISWGAIGLIVLTIGNFASAVGAALFYTYFYFN